MTTQNKDKLKTLFKDILPGEVITSARLLKLSISRDLLKYYLKSGWLESLARGAYKKPGDTINWTGAISAIQNQSDSKVHVGAVTALSLQGLSHYVRFGGEKLYLFTPHKKELPKWFKDLDWGSPVFHKQTEFLPQEPGIIKFSVEYHTVYISTPERAILECIYLAPKIFDLVECYHMMEGLVNLKPTLLNQLLTRCSSVQVKRLFLLMADKANHQWLNFIKKEDIDLGTGNRLLAKNGVYYSKYQLSIPKELAEL